MCESCINKMQYESSLRNSREQSKVNDMKGNVSSVKGNVSSVKGNVSSIKEEISGELLESKWKEQQQQQGLSQL